MPSRAERPEEKTGGGSKTKAEAARQKILNGKEKQSLSLLRILTPTYNVNKVYFYRIKGHRAR
jgi:hypothetical protein